MLSYRTFLRTSALSRSAHAGLLAAAAAFLGSPALAQPILPPPPQGVQTFRDPGALNMEFATIASPGNASLALPNPPSVSTGQYISQGRGSVPYTFALSRTEITTREWLEFVNTFAPRGDLPGGGRPDFFGPLSFVWGSFRWGAINDPSYTGPGFRYTAFSPEALDLPVGNMTWRNAAVYCNWLHNGRRNDLQSLLSGAYDTATWGYTQASGFSDALTRLPGARYWIPSADEWIKAAFYDPNRFGPSSSGWWMSMDRSDSVPVPGLPGTPGATTNSGLTYPLPGVPSPGSIVVGSYPDSQSPWGLLDTSGGVSEWIEEPFYSDYERTRVTERGLMGGFDGDGRYQPNSSTVWSISSASPRQSSSGDGLRIATIPAPSSLIILAVCTPAFHIRRRSHAHP